MAKEIENEDGTKEMVYTAEEIAAKDAEIERLNNLSQEKTDNFKKVNASTEKLEGEVASLRETLAQKEARERDSAKNMSAIRYHGNNEELKTKIDANYAILAGMPESTPEEISARMEAAARLAGISVESRNPLYSPTYGESPRPKEQTSKDDEFLKSEKGIAAQKAMGFDDAEINPTKS